MIYAILQWQYIASATPKCITLHVQQGQNIHERTFAGPKRCTIVRTSNCKHLTKTHDPNYKNHRQRRAATNSSLKIDEEQDVFFPFAPGGPLRLRWSSIHCFRYITDLSGSFLTSFWMSTKLDTECFICRTL